MIKNEYGIFYIRKKNSVLIYKKMNVVELLISCIAFATTYMCKQQFYVDREIIVQMHLQINLPA